MHGTTTIRVSESLREQLRRVAERRQTSMIDTLADALDALRRDEFFQAMANAEAALRANPDAWASYQAESAAWTREELGR